MYRVSELLSKPLITLSDAKFAGTVCNIFFDKNFRRGRYVELFSEDENAPEQRYVALDRLRLGADAAVVSHEGLIRSLIDDLRSEAAPNPINRAAYNLDGKNLGRVTDVILDGVAVRQFEIEGKAYESDTLVSYSDKILIFNDTGKPFRPVRPRKPRIPEGAEQITVTATATTVELPEKLTVTAAPRTGERSDYKFLLGKKTVKHILSHEGNVIVPEGSVVTAELIDRARAAGKLVQLALNSL